MTRSDMPPPAPPVPLAYPFRGSWMARNSPGRRVPSHGTHLFGTTYAIDFIAVDASGRSAPWGLRAALATERPEGFVGFGRPVLAPIPGTVVISHDGESDHAARRSLLAGVPYLLGQARRAREGAAAVAGNHVVIEVADGGPYVLLAHLRRGSVRRRVGERVEVGDVLGECGNSGNSTQPHIHVQVTDSIEWETARGLPIGFRVRGAGVALPGESEIVVA